MFLAAASISPSCLLPKKKRHCPSVFVYVCVCPSRLKSVLAVLLRGLMFSQLYSKLVCLTTQAYICVFFPSSLKQAQLTLSTRNKIFGFIQSRPFPPLFSNFYTPDFSFHALQKACSLPGLAGWCHANFSQPVQPWCWHHQPAGVCAGISWHFMEVAYSNENKCTLKKSRKCACCVTLVLLYYYMCYHYVFFLNI